MREAFPVPSAMGNLGIHGKSGRARRRGRDASPPAPELPTFSQQYQIAHLWADLPCNVDQAIIGLMDPAHGPFVHQAWWWRTRHSIRDKSKTV